MARHLCTSRRLLLALGLCTSILVLLAWPRSLQLLQGSSLSPQSSQSGTPSMSLDSSHWERICRPAAVFGGTLGWCPRLHQLGDTGGRAGQQLEQQLEQHPDKCAAALQMPQVATLVIEVVCLDCPTCMACLAGTWQGACLANVNPLCAAGGSALSHTRPPATRAALGGLAAQRKRPGGWQLRRCQAVPAPACGMGAPGPQAGSGTCSQCHCRQQQSLAH